MYKRLERLEKRSTKSEPQKTPIDISALGDSLRGVMDRYPADKVYTGNNPHERSMSALAGALRKILDI